MSCDCEPIVPHRYPVLKRPVSRASFIREVQRACRKAKLKGKPTVLFPAALDEEHARNARRYAQVIPSTMQFEFAQATLCLPKKFRDALIWHEIGHVIDPHGTEDDADTAAHRVSGKRIKYDRRWPGKGLQSNPMRRRNPEVQELTEERYERLKALATDRLSLDGDLEQIGVGGERVVFGLQVGDREPFAFKVDQGTRWHRQTEAEIHCLRNAKSPMAPQIYDWDDENYRWIEMELMTPLPDAPTGTFEEISGIDWEDFSFAFETYDGFVTDWDGVTKNIPNTRKARRFMADVRAFAESCGLATSELGLPDNWGVTDDGRLKPLDLGY
jgi:hypothetical protein